MATATRLALIGDYDPASVAHQGIPLALALAGDGTNACEWHWIHTSDLSGDPAAQLSQFQGLWCVPAAAFSTR